MRPGRFSPRRWTLRPQAIQPGLQSTGPRTLADVSSPSHEINQLRLDRLADAEEAEGEVGGAALVGRGAGVEEDGVVLETAEGLVAVAEDDAADVGVGGEGGSGAGGRAPALPLVAVDEADVVLA